MLKFVTKRYACRLSAGTFRRGRDTRSKIFYSKQIRKPQRSGKPTTKFPKQEKPLQIFVRSNKGKHSRRAAKRHVRNVVRRGKVCACNAANAKQSRRKRQVNQSAGKMAVTTKALLSAFTETVPLYFSTMYLMDFSPQPWFALSLLVVTISLFSSTHNLPS